MNVLQAIALAKAGADVKPDLPGQDWLRHDGRSLVAPAGPITLIPAEWLDACWVVLEFSAWATERRIEQAVDLLVGYGTRRDAATKGWVIDQVLRVLAGTGYDTAVRRAETRKPGQVSYWDRGTHPDD